MADFSLGVGIPAPCQVEFRVPKTRACESVDEQPGSALPIEMSSGMHLGSIST